MTFSKRQLKKAATYSVIVALILPLISGVLFLASLAPAPFGFGLLMGLLSFPFFTYAFR